MNALVERILDLPPRQRVFLVVGSVGLLLFFYAYLFYWPRVLLIQDREHQREMMQEDRDHKAAMVKNLVQAQKDLQRLEGDLRRAVAQLPDTKEIPDLLSNISSLGRESGLEIIEFRQRPEQYEDFYASVLVDMVVRGTYHQVATFFDKVGRMARIVNVTDVSIKSPVKPDSEAVILDTACSAVTFRFLDEGERERIAKEKEKAKGR
jgi:type IV pilus assembly protein PilO